MIIGRDTSPKRQLYYIGGVVLEIIEENFDTNFSLLDMFQKVNEREKISFNLFSLTLDWLFLLDAIIINKGLIKRCF